ncbi:MAG TPA: alginate lyase family protein [Burkholderiales bacterium]|nr:alginate lyase family protein [Burkholderiales bacterium]
MSAALAWKLNRLKLMGPAEICWRARKGVAAALERRGFGLANDVGAGASAAGSAWVAALPMDLHAAPYVEAAERLLSGRWDLLSLRDCPLGFPPRWNRDPKTGVEAPLDFGKGIDYRDERVAGDIKYLWELNRHLELVTLAQAWHLTRKPRFAEAARSLLLSWLDQCPYPRGPHWTSSLESGIRIVNWACAWHLLGGEASRLFAGKEGQAFRRRWLVAIYQHCHFISHNLSRHSSANNHLFGELMGLFVASVTWPRWRESLRWQEAARRELEAEATRQNAADGTNREQAFWYHHEVADMMILCLLFGRANRVDFSGRFAKRLESMLEFIAAVMDAGGHVPMIGDADDAVMVRFSREPEFCPYRSLLSTGAVLFDRGDFKAKAGRFDEKSRWLLGDAASERFGALSVATAKPARLVFPEGGYYVLGQDFGTPREVKTVVDAGPLGYLSIAAHGHADALAFTLSAGGHEILVDPGTYAYHCQKRWRDYFRGTSAHNTLRVDGEEQSVPGGNFMWLAHARARCEHFESGAERDAFEGVHDGYLRLDDPVRHRRRIEFDKRNTRIEVRDTLECREEHFVELHWHLAEGCEARVSGHAVELDRANLRIRVECPSELGTPEVVAGRDDPPLGWISRRLDEKTPSPTIVCRGRISGGANLVTAVTIAIGATGG